MFLVGQSYYGAEKNNLVRCELLSASRSEVGDTTWQLFELFNN